MVLIGKVVKGQGFARLAFGLPTANLDLDEAVTLEAGVYVGYTTVEAGRFPSVIYIGPQASEKVETHLFGFDADLYDQTVEIEIVKLISEYVPWKSEEQMKAKVAADVQKARGYFSTAF
ncbi:MAG: riboflavin kinase [Patescibacteria group bacterium]